MICADEPYGDVMRAGCHGDSGGPFVCKESSSGKFVLQGIVSWGSGNNKQYTVFARISELRLWIDATPLKCLAPSDFPYEFQCENVKS